MDRNEGTQMTMNPMVSIIVPVYNAEKYLERCLDSLVSQTLREIEIICVNDGSTDKSMEILSSYAKKHPFLLILDQKNQGPGTARNTALENARGKYIIFCDADDTLEPETCLECTTLMENNKVDLIIFNFNAIDVDREETCSKKSLGREDDYISIVRPEMEGILSQKESVKISVHASVWGYFYRSDLINQYKIRFTKFKACEDSIFFHSYLMIIQSGYALNKTFYNYYVYSGSLSDIAYNKYPWFNRFLLLQRIFRYTFMFSMKNKIPFKQLYFFYWMFYYIRNRI